MFERLDKLMPMSIKRAGAADTVRAAMLLDTAVKVLTDRFGDDAAFMKPMKFKSGTVTVRCTDAALTDEIRMQEADILAELNRRLGGEIVERLRPVG